MPATARRVRLSEDFVPVSEFKAQAADWLRKAEATGGPVVVTVNGKPAGVLLSPRAFDELTERAGFLAAVKEGLADADAGRTFTQESVVARMKARRRRKAA